MSLLHLVPGSFGSNKGGTGAERVSNGGIRPRSLQIVFDFVGIARDWTGSLAWLAPHCSISCLSTSLYPI